MTLLDNIASHHKISDAASVGIKRATIDKMETSTSQRMISGIVCTDSLDMEGEVVVPAGLDTSYFPERVKAVYLNHNYDELPVGTCRRLVRDGDGWYCSTFITRNPIGNEILVAIEEGALNGFSIGMIVMSARPPTEEDTRVFGWCDRVIDGAKLLEYSIVSMPANPSALMDFAASRPNNILAKALKFDSDITPKVEPAKVDTYLWDASGRVWSYS
jgi:HK97 family phage prohead protease